MLPFVTPVLLNGHALPVDGNEPHAQVGNHLRVSHHPLLGLPVAPFIVQRAVVDSYKVLNTRDTVVFTNSSGVLTPPFDVTPDSPVTARVERTGFEVCIWAQIEASDGPVVDVPPPTPQPIPTQGLSVRSSVPIRGSRVFPTLMPEIQFPNIEVPFPLPFPLPNNGLVCEAFIDSAMGPTSIGTRSQNRYAFSGPGIVEIKITGAGRVYGMLWIEARDRQPLKYNPYVILNLPHEGGARYVSIEDAVPLAVGRVEVQAPKRRPLQETVDAPSPNSAPLANIPFEKARVESLGAVVLNDLEELVNNVAELPLDQTVTDKFVDENGTEVGESTMARLSRVIQMQLDPGTASFLGYKLRDPDWVEVEDRIVFYQIDGYFRDFPAKPIWERTTSELLFDGIVAAVPPDNRNWSREELMERYANNVSQIPDAKLHPDATKRLESHQEYFGIGTVAVADRSAPLDKIQPPQVPVLAGVTNPRHIGWMPATPPVAIREVQMDIEKVRTAGLLAAGKQTPATGTSTAYNPLNKTNTSGFHLPLVLSINTEDADDDVTMTVEPGKGFIADRMAGPSDIRYFIAQQDRFGRWSNWTGATAAAGPRPKPPRPEFQAYYTQPNLADASSMGGKIQVKVMVPDIESLAPGSHLLDQLELKLTDDNGLQIVLEPEANKSTFAEDPTTFYLVVSRSGPILQPTEVQNMLITARWVDVTGVKSDESEPQNLKMTDPRPPTQLTLPDALQYAARPDVTGLSWVEHRWTVTGGQNTFGIFYTDENRLKAHLEDEGPASVLITIVDAPDAAARAGIYKANTNLFPDHLFEKLQGVDVSFASGEVGFRHGVSGSLRLLNFYKIAAIAESGTKPVLMDLPMIIYGIPNSDPPARPSVLVIPVEPITDEKDYVAKVTIELLAGTTLGETWRLRRSSVGSSNLNNMPVVTTGSMGALDAVTGLQVATHRDDGPVQVASAASLRPWVRYSWVAEVQGVPEVGSAAAGTLIAGRWSSASDPVSLIMIPALAPESLTITDVSGTTVAGGLVDVRLGLEHSETLSGGTIGSFKYRLSRRTRSGEPLILVRETTIEGDGPFKIDGMTDDPGDVVTLETEYIIELIDPVGRNSAQTTGTIS